jgi:hypothetical protein
VIYGNSRTIHGTQHLNVEVGPDGHVVAVWFRCMRLPFTEHRVEEGRAEEMTRAADLPKLNAVDIEGAGLPVTIAQLTREEADEICDQLELGDESCLTGPLGSGMEKLRALQGGA